MNGIWYTVFSLFSFRTWKGLCRQQQLLTYLIIFNQSNAWQMDARRSVSCLFSYKCIPCCHFLSVGNFSCLLWLILFYCSQIHTLDRFAFQFAIPMPFMGIGTKVSIYFNCSCYYFKLCGTNSHYCRITFEFLNTINFNLVFFVLLLRWNNTPS